MTTHLLSFSFFGFDAAIVVVTPIGAMLYGVVGAGPGGADIGSRSRCLNLLSGRIACRLSERKVALLSARKVVLLSARAEAGAMRPLPLPNRYHGFLLTGVSGVVLVLCTCGSGTKSSCSGG